MDHDFSLILTFVGGLAAALLFGLIARKLHLSPLVGYLLAGVAVGPYSPGFVADSHTVEQFAELGVILLMFGVGLHFHLKDLIAVQKVAVPGAGCADIRGYRAGGAGRVDVRMVRDFRTGFWQWRFPWRVP